MNLMSNTNATKQDNKNQEPEAKQPETNPEPSTGSDVIKLAKPVLAYLKDHSQGDETPMEVLERLLVSEPPKKAEMLSVPADVILYEATEVGSQNACNGETFFEYVQEKSCAGFGCWREADLVMEAKAMAEGAKKAFGEECANLPHWNREARMSVVVRIEA